MSNRKHHPRAVDAYLPPKNYVLVTKYACLNEMSKSKVINMAVKAFFDSMPKDLRDRIIRYSEVDFDK